MPIAQPSAPVLPLLSRSIIYVALLAAVTLPLLLPERLFTRTIEATPAVTDLYQKVSSLDSGAAVLVAFDYDPTTQGEMDVLARVIIGHLMDQEARVVAVSLLPAGPAVAESVLDSAAADHPMYADGYGARYANLGYVPGQAAGVRLLGESLLAASPRDHYGGPLADLEIMDQPTSIQSFDLIIELAAAQDTLRWWIEQASTPYDVSLGAALSASVDPLARPYYETESQQLVGVMGGVVGATMYEALRGDQASFLDIIAARLDSQLAGHAVLILVLLVGNGVYLVRRGAGRGR
jgi:hypothetical protein